MKHPQKQHRLFLRMQVISEPGVPSNVPPGIFGSIAHAGFWGDAYGKVNNGFPQK